MMEVDDIASSMMMGKMAAPARSSTMQVTTLVSLPPLFSPLFY
jgi:hypothetical protein